MGFNNNIIMFCSGNWCRNAPDDSFGLIVKSGNYIEDNRIDILLSFFYALYQIQYKTFLCVLPFSWVKNRTICRLSESLIVTNKRLTELVCAQIMHLVECDNIYNVDLTGGFPSRR